MSDQKRFEDHVMDAVRSMNKASSYADSASTVEIIGRLGKQLHGLIHSNRDNIEVRVTNRDDLSRLSRNQPLEGE